MTAPPKITPELVKDLQDKGFWEGLYGPRVAELARAYLDAHPALFGAPRPVRQAPEPLTTEDLDALPLGSKVLDETGEVWARYRLGKPPHPLRWRSTSGAYGKTSVDLTHRGIEHILIWKPSE